MNFAYRGSKHYKTKLTDEDVILIIHLVVNEGLTQSEVARKFELNRQTVHNIVHGKSWRHIGVINGH